MSHRSSQRQKIKFDTNEIRIIYGNKQEKHNNVRSYTHKGLHTWLLKHELNHKDNNRHAKVDKEKPIRPQPDTKNDKQLRNAESRRNILPQERILQLAFPHQMVHVYKHRRD